MTGTVLPSTTVVPSRFDVNGSRVRDVLGVERRREAEDDDHGEDAEHRHCDPVSPQPPAGERPGAGPGERGAAAARRLARERLAHRQRVERGPDARPHPDASLLDPRLADEPVELLAEREVADALRDEVDVLRVEQRRHRRLVRDHPVDLRPQRRSRPPRS